MSYESKKRHKEPESETVEQEVIAATLREMSKTDQSGWSLCTHTHTHTHTHTLYC